MVNIKLCGLKEPSHMETAWKLGVKYVGVVFFNHSPRSLTIEDARPLLENAPKDLVKVGLVVNPDDELVRLVSDLNLDMIQLHGLETISRVQEIRKVSGLDIIKALGVREKADLKKVYQYAKVADQILIDAKPESDVDLPGGNGTQFNWDLIKEKSWTFPWFLAGGINEANLLEALKKTNAKQVDLSSGVEDQHGRKDIDRIVRFVKKVKEYEECHSV